MNGMDDIFKIANEQEFNSLCMKIFHLQAENCEVYREYLNLLGVEHFSVESIDRIPFLPIKFFKNREIATLDSCGKCFTNGASAPHSVFTSSSTTGMVPAKHLVYDMDIYEKSFRRGFEYFYGSPEEYTILALLPSYLERKGSSLVYMAEHLIKSSLAKGNRESGFYLYDYSRLYDTLCSLKEKGGKTILLGVSFALLDFVEKYKVEFPDLIVMETGGMKGRGKEIGRERMHSILHEGFGVKHIHSEYGMAELMSQAYSKGEGIFYPVPWMKIIIRDFYNPLRYVSTGKEDSGKKGGINIIDLANLNTCSFIESEDMGELTPCGGFLIHGRIKEAELRGCNLLLE